MISTFSSILQRRREINAAYALRSGADARLKVDEVAIIGGRLKVRVGKLWITQKIVGSVNVPPIAGTVDKKGNFQLPTQSIAVRISTSWE